MTKIFKIIIVLLMIALVTTFIVSAVSLQSKTNNILTAYSARREELAARQLQIQDMITSLNSTLQAEMIRQQAIATELGIKMNETITAPISIPTTPVVTATPPAPVVMPKPKVITRAS